MIPLIEFIHDTTFEMLPKETIHEAVRCLVDTLGVAAGGSQTDMSRIIRGPAHHQFGGTAAHLWFDGRVASPAGAALANAITIDSLDAHDGHKLTKGHVGCGVIPGLIAVLEAEKSLMQKNSLPALLSGMS